MTPQEQLAHALAHFARRSGKTYREIAAEARVDSSYISRILAGSRRPSWPVTARLVQACRRDDLLEAIQELWNAAVTHPASGAGHPLPDPGHLVSGATPRPFAARPNALDAVSYEAFRGFRVAGGIDPGPLRATPNGEIIPE
ncbi:helix-turn-helix domain-containing protein [Streptomyces sp. NPDC057638]|uniref:helix-turn-helix domain-containing protein n=1 Tax=Streptomyces sp. NPDC057638 TaxID=3346190 RepID=UPI003692CFD2